ncbi:acyltransferase family protein [Hafnia alvei]|uniref:acyltransferase family protein n=1 Tax=Hafnia alvei TaxID=569 RepID=UPI00093019DB|nr:acyltransferase family protein [Hafnia alvei]
MNFRYDINGLRCLAVMMVVLFHFKVPLLNGGFSGVDIFFVISGFLMSKIYLKKLDTGLIGIYSFYKSRFSRIYPALFQQSQ